MNRFAWNVERDGIKLTLSSVSKQFFREITTQIHISDWAAGDDAKLSRGLVALSWLWFCRT